MARLNSDSVGFNQGLGGSVGASGSVLQTSQTFQNAVLSESLIDQGTANYRGGFYFRSKRTGSVASVEFFMYRDGGNSTGTYDLELRNYTAGGTVGSLIQAISVNPAGVSTLSGSQTLVTVNYTSANIISGNDYCFVFNESGLTGNGAYRTRGRNSLSGNNIGFLESSNGGSSWTEDDNSDPYFIIRMN